MSTWLYLECLSHDPPLRSDGESGQHLYDLPQIRKDVADRETLARLWVKHEWLLSLGHHFRDNTVRFLAEHPKCQVGIRDEYGRPHDLTEDAEGQESLIPDPRTTTEVVF